MSLVVIARNLSDDLVRSDDTTDYDVEVSVNRKRFIWCGTIKNHVRSKGAEELLRLIADEVERHGSTEPS